MEQNLCIAISGTPGCGKTSLSELFASNGAKVVSVKELAQLHDCLGELNLEDGATEIDIHKLVELWENGDDGLVVVDGHLSHFLDVDAIVLLRCNPSELESRLSKRGYAENKVKANMEWELISGTWSELLEFEIELPIREYDATVQNTEEIYQNVCDWIEQNLPGASIMEQSEASIDWMNQ